MASVATAGGFALGFRPAQAIGADAKPEVPVSPFEAYVAIDRRGRITVVSSQFDSGQGIYHCLATLVQEELEGRWEDIEVIGGYGNPLYKNEILGMQATAGSLGTSISFERYRRAGAAAKSMLIAAAAAAWKVKPEEIRARRGVLSHPSGRRSLYGEFAASAARLQPPTKVVLKDPKDWIYIGNEKLARYDSGVKSRGQQEYPIDVKLPGMLTAVMIHPPRFGSRLKSFDARRAKAMPGVVDIVQIPRGIAVVTDHMWRALEARNAVAVEWDDSHAEVRSSAEIMAAYREAAKAGGKVVAVNKGNVEAALASSAKTLEALYEFPYLAHAPMEPLNAVVRMNANGTLEVWAGHQYPDTYQALCAKMAGIAPDKVVLRTMQTGGSFGRRAVFDADVIAEALATAKALNFRAPVKVQWTREDDMRAGWYRPAYVHQLKAGLDAQGNITGWRDTIVGQSLVLGTPFEAWAPGGLDPTTVDGSSNMAYNVPSHRVDLSSPVSPVTVSFLRSVGLTHTSFAVEHFMDEMARAAGQDPLQFRLSLLAAKPRHVAALRLAASKAGWGQTLPAGRSRGIAVIEYAGTVVSNVAEVSIVQGMPRVHRVTCAVDCGLAVNPGQVRSQIEGGVGFGLSLVMQSEVSLDKGKVVQGNFSDYQLLRLPQMPHVDVHIVKSSAPPTGIGELGVPAIGPAVANALLALTGKPTRMLPFSSQEWSSASS